MSIKGLIKLGQTVITPRARGTLNMQDVLKGLQRHEMGDFGDVCDEDKETNLEGLQNGGQVISAYTDRNDNRFWIITEGDRSVTTILLPDEY